MLQFLTRDVMLAWYMLSLCVCLSVCVSVTLRYCIKTDKRTITQIMPHDSPVTLVYWCKKLQQKIDCNQMQVG